MIIKLPSTPDNEPDWNYMEQYIKSLNHKPLTTRNKSENVLQLDIENWKEFKVGDFLIYIQQNLLRGSLLVTVLVMVCR